MITKGSRKVSHSFLLDACADVLYVLSIAMQTAAATAMRMMGEYKSTGKVNMQPGEMQKLMGLAMSLF